MAKRARLDAELVRRRLVASRTEAQRAIQAGTVVVNGVPATRAATLVANDARVELTSEPSPFVSRGGSKLDGALERMDVRVAGRRWLDAGASTGGFTDRLLKGGATAVITVDVGYGQLDWSLRNDPRVIVLERTNVRNLSAADLPWRPGAAVADLSFISLTLVLPALRAVVVEDGDFVLLVKPQFEVGRDAVGPGGVVRDPSLWRRAVQRVVDSAGELGLGVAGAAPSHLPGPAGNREFFVHLRSGGSVDVSVLDEVVDEVAP
ncbi:MAG TPA: TlyA family RNA methyltransferase [Actinomycetota bacterium]|jgi:23S rRNA (cytidine1920-2'-O)/16S rRNA (cytidine1409-2'-O)-methyltransferase|nr:TlyA family RNA methyltransferase [Actinomycetota bacterium]